MLRITNPIVNMLFFIFDLDLPVRGLFQYLFCSATDLRGAVKKLKRREHLFSYYLHCNIIYYSSLVDLLALMSSPTAQRTLSSSMDSPSSSRAMRKKEKYVKLNVGGFLYYTAVDTLMKQVRTEAVMMFRACHVDNGVECDISYFWVCLVRFCVNSQGDNMLSAMFSGRMEVEKDPEGWVTIDRDGRYGIGRGRRVCLVFGRSDWISFAPLPRREVAADTGGV